MKADNDAYHSGRIPLDRVKAWRNANPGYWRRRSLHPAKKPVIGADAIPALSSLLADLALQDSCGALQDSWSPLSVALIGLIARLRGSALQDVIARELSEIMLTGRAILGELPRPNLNAESIRRRSRT